MAAKPPPYILNGYPRMGGQLKQLQSEAGAAGSIALAVRCTGPLSGADARLCNYLITEGIPVHEVAPTASESSRAEELRRVLATMEAGGMQLPQPMPAQVQEQEPLPAQEPDPLPSVQAAIRLGTVPAIPGAATQNAVGGKDVVAAVELTAQAVDRAVRSADQ